VDIMDASNQNVVSESISTFGEKVQVHTRRAGSMMSNIGKWLVEVRSFETTAVAILISAVFFIFLFGVAFGIRFDRSRADVIPLNGSRYELTGMAKVDVPGSDNFIPVYKESHDEKK
jgi:hypothetical protein